MIAELIQKTQKEKVYLKSQEMGNWNRFNFAFDMFDGQYLQEGYLGNCDKFR